MRIDQVMVYGVRVRWRDKDNGIMTYKTYWYPKWLTCILGYLFDNLPAQIRYGSKCVACGTTELEELMHEDGDIYVSDGKRYCMACYPEWLCERCYSPNADDGGYEGVCQSCLESEADAIYDAIRDGDY